MCPSDEFHKMSIRVPLDVKEWLETQTLRNASSLASEIVRAVRDRMDNTETRNRREGV